MNGRTQNSDYSQRKFALTVVLIVVGALAVLYFGALNWDDFKRRAGQQWQGIWWDTLQHGKVQWDEYILTLPSGDYGWINHQDGDVEVFRRNSATVASLTLKKSARANWPFQSYIDTICFQRPTCAGLSRSTEEIRTRRVSLVSYEDLTPDKRVRFAAFVFLPEPRVVITVAAEDAPARDQTMQLGLSILNQIVEQSDQKTTISR